MKAILVRRHGGPDVLGLEDVPDPEPGNAQVLVRIEAAGVNFLDVYHRTGQYPVKLPFTPGVEGAGSIVRVGPGVSGVKPGDPVAYVNVMGSYAEFVVVPADRLVRIPDGLDAKRAAAAMLQGMTAHYLTHSTYTVREGDTVLVHAAAGGVGLLLCQMASRRGAWVIGTVSTAAKAALAREAGAADTILYTEKDFVEEVARLTGERGVNVVYDSVGRDTFDGSLRCLKVRGMLVLFGQSSGAVAPFDPQILNRRGSLSLTRPSLVHYTADREELLSRAGDVLGWVRDGTLTLRIARELPLEQARLAHEELEGRRTAGKVLLVT